MTTQTENTSGAVIRRTFHGGSKDVTFEDFAYDAVQDEQTAVEIAFAMLEGDGTHTYTADPSSMYFEMFEIIDRDGLYAALNLLRERGDKP